MSMCSIARMSSTVMVYFLRVQRRIEGHVHVVRKHQFKSVLAGRQGQHGLGLTFAEVQFLSVAGQRRTELNSLKSVSTSR